VKRLVVIHKAIKNVDVIEEDTPSPGFGEVLVRTRLSGISAGTEKLIYQGFLSPDLKLDESIPALTGGFDYPLRYGYCCVGRVVSLGAGVDQTWMDRRVFGFNPHESAFCSRVENLIQLPDDISDENAVFLANMETAVNLVQDGMPIIGETVVVFGLGVVGLLTVGILNQYPLEGLFGFDLRKKRRRIAQSSGKIKCFDPMGLGADDCLRLLIENGCYPEGADLCFEVSGAPEALNLAIGVAGFGSRIVVGSWYGSQPVKLNLGDRFHRKRIRLISSQVSTISPSLMVSWDKSRRMKVAINQLRLIDPSRMISHVFPVRQADEAFRLMDERPEETLQIILDYASD
jgi:2-desacetyl-2-hydroxyethyl bacteriochlorophyllide A dehydrogenase